MAITFNHNDKLYVSDSNVGIGTASPSDILSVNSSSTETILHLTNTSTGTATSDGLRMGLVGASAYFLLRENANMLFHTNNTERMRITAGGNVGIGTTSPGAFSGTVFASPILDLSGSFNIRGLSSDNNAVLNMGGDTYRKSAIYTPIGTDTPYLGFGVSSSGTSSSTSEAMRIIANGNVGIGTASPAQKLEVSFAASTFGARFTRNDNAGSSLIEFANNTGVKNIIGYNAGVDGYTVGTSSSTNLTIKNNGNVGIGTTSPQAKFHAIGHTMFSGGAYQTGYNTQNGLVIDSSNVTSASGAYGAGIEFTRLGDSTIKKAGIAPIQETADSDSIGLSFHTARTTTTTDPTYEAMRLTHDSKVGIGESAPASRLEVKGTAMSQFRMQTAGGPSTTNDTSGNVGDMAYDDDHLYIKTVNGWGRVALDFAF